MSYIMQQIAPALVHQHDALPFCNQLSYKNLQIKMEDVDISVSLVLQRVWEGNGFIHDAKVLSICNTWQKMSEKK